MSIEDLPILTMRGERDSRIGVNADFSSAPTLTRSSFDDRNSVAGTDDLGIVASSGKPRARGAGRHWVNFSANMHCTNEKRHLYALGLLAGMLRQGEYRGGISIGGNYLSPVCLTLRVLCYRVSERSAVLETESQSIGANTEGSFWPDCSTE